MTARPVLTRKEAPVSRYRRWNELLELLATSGSLQVEDGARLEDEGVEVVLA
jgi:hypothetical protein